MARGSRVNDNSRANRLRQLVSSVLLKHLVFEINELQPFLIAFINISMSTPNVVKEVSAGSAFYSVCVQSKSACDST